MTTLIARFGGKETLEKRSDGSEVEDAEFGSGGGGGMNEPGMGGGAGMFEPGIGGGAGMTNAGLLVPSSAVVGDVAASTDVPIAKLSCATSM